MPNTQFVTKLEITKAYDLLQGKSVVPIKIFKSEFLSNLTNSEVYICSVMPDAQQGTGSFKDFGAYNKLHHLVKDLSAGEQISIAVASEGNHAPAVVNAARILERERNIVVSVELFVPQTISTVKKANITRLMSANDVLHQDFPDFAAAIAAAKNCGATFVSGYDDPYIINGQGAIGEEVFKQLGDVGRIYCSVGGGGLGAALSVYFADTETAVFCSELAHIPSATASLVAGEVTKLERARPADSTFMSKRNIDIIADGITLPTIGDLPFALIKANKTPIATATVDQIAAAFAQYVDGHQIDISKAGQAGAGVPELACMPALVDLLRRAMQTPKAVAGQTQVLVLSGGNIAVEKALAVYSVGKEIIDSGRFEACLEEATPFFDPALPTASRYSLPRAMDISNSQFLS